MAICRDIFDYPDPFKMPYEFVLIGGAKMSSSKGIGLKAHDLTQIMPPAVGRFLYARNGIKSQTNFDPSNSQAIPDLFDDYKKAYGEYKKDPKSDLGRAYALSQVGDNLIPPDVRFQKLIQYVQSPNMQKEIERLGAVEWSRYAKVWVERFAPEQNRFIILEKMPDGLNLSGKQKEYLSKILSEMEKEWDEEEFQKQLYEWSKEIGLPSKEAFAAIYSPLFGKTFGPKAGYIILENKEKVKERFQEASE
jgi:lysyl-tRNA synthetase class 1